MCRHLREKVLKNAKDAKLAWIKAAFEERTEIRGPVFYALMPLANGINF